MFSLHHDVISLYLVMRESIIVLRDNELYLRADDDEEKEEEATLFWK